MIRMTAVLWDRHWIEFHFQCQIHLLSVSGKANLRKMHIHPMSTVLLSPGGWEVPGFGDAEEELQASLSAHSEVTMLSLSWLLLLPAPPKY